MKSIHNINTLWIDINSTIFLQKIWIHISTGGIVKVTCLGEGNLWIHTSRTPLEKLILCYILLIAEGLGKYMYLILSAFVGK